MKKILFILFLFLPHKAFSDFITSGNIFLDKCSENYILCKGYVQGITDAISVYNSWYDPKNCRFEIPLNVTDNQLVDIIIKYYRDNPNIRHHWNTYTIIEQFAKIFPCPKK